MNDVIRKAILERRSLAFTYKGVQREVEPHTYGVQGSGKEGLCAWQLTGGTGDGFRLFLVAQMASLSMGEPFSDPRPGYHRGDRRFRTIFAEL